MKAFCSTTLGECFGKGIKSRRQAKSCCKLAM